MRPISLELEGFASFRKRATVDFDACDLFVLTGPTGSGKSSIIDAITFALYGTIARLDNRNAVVPVINQGSLRARVSLTFDAGGHRYTLAREAVRRGASKIALERDGVPVAATVKEVDREVETLLGLSFEQFTRCVVLPQGDFAAFLHAGTKDRQNLLVKLLDADLFRSVQKLASTRATTLKGETDTAERDLERVKDAVRVAARDLLLEPTQFTDEDEDEFVAGGKARVETLEALVAKLEAAVEAGQRLAADTQAAAAEAERCREGAALLAGVLTPSAVAGFQQKLDDARRAVVAADQALALSESAQATAEAALAALPAKAEVAEVVRQHEGRAALQTQHAAATQGHEAAAQALAPAVAALAEAEAALADARAARELILHQNAAYAASQGLAAGDPCPVCGEPLAAIPNLPRPPGVATMESAVATTDVAWKAAQRTAGDAEKAEAIARQMLDALVAALEGAATALDGKADEAACRAALTAITLAEAEVAKSRAVFTAARTARASAQTALAQVQAQAATAWKEFEARSNACAALGTPPTRTPDDLAASWASLQTWAAAEAAAYGGKAAAADAESARLTAERQALAAGQTADCAALGVTVAPGQQPLLAANTAHANAQRDQRELIAAVLERRRLETHRETTRRNWTAAATLNHHLQVTRFEQWYLEEALSRLLGGASTTLRELSSGQYSLQLDENRKDFLVVDHANADETRPVKTLSGGETFLASLSLALALADEIALLAPATAPKLEALFLDEGFGTLDADTLDTVAAAIEELGARGRMVGIVTHVPELAARVPVRFKVTKVGGTSAVEREQ